MFGGAQEKEGNMHWFSYGCWLLYYSRVLKKKIMRRKRFVYYLLAVFLCYLKAFLTLAV
jgi:hypothetical protein